MSRESDASRPTRAIPARLAGPASNSTRPAGPSALAATGTPNRPTQPPQPAARRSPAKAPRTGQRAAGRSARSLHGNRRQSDHIHTKSVRRGGPGSRAQGPEQRQGREVYDTGGNPAHAPISRGSRTAPERAGPCRRLGPPSGPATPRSAEDPGQNRGQSQRQGGTRRGRERPSRLHQPMIRRQSPEPSDPRPIRRPGVEFASRGGPLALVEQARPKRPAQPPNQPPVQPGQGADRATGRRPVCPLIARKPTLERPNPYEERPPRRAAGAPRRGSRTAPGAERRTTQVGTPPTPDQPRIPNRAEGRAEDRAMHCTGGNAAHAR